MKTYIATYFRHNPQFSNGGYETKRKIEAKTIASARKIARDLSEKAAYGSMELLKVELAN